MGINNVKYFLSATCKAFKRYFSRIISLVIYWKSAFVKKSRLKLVSKLSDAHVLNNYIILVPDLQQSTTWWEAQVMHKHSKL